MRKFIIILLSFSLFGAQCRKNPPADSFYFRCYIDGKEYIPNNCANCRVAKLLGDTILLINANSGFETVAMGIGDSPIGMRTYSLDQKRGGGGIYDNNPLVNDIFKTDSIHTGVLNILTLDKTKRIISGSFHFKAYNAYRNDSVNVTNGTFRLKYDTN